VPVLEVYKRLVDGFAMIYFVMAGLAALTALVIAMFILGSRTTALQHARFTAAEIEELLLEVVSPESKYHEAWGLFLMWPIGDHYLESIRQRCLAIVNGDMPPPGCDLSSGAERAVRALLAELKARRQHS
jgi:hypothetical protein